MFHELLVIFFGLFSLIAGIIGIELPVIVFVFAAYYIYYGFSSFPFSREDSHKWGLAIGCIFFVLAGFLAIVFSSWWFFTAGMVLGYGAACFIPSK